MNLNTHFPEVTVIAKSCLTHRVTIFHRLFIVTSFKIQITIEIEQLYLRNCTLSN